MQRLFLPGREHHQPAVGGDRGQLERDGALLLLQLVHLLREAERRLS
jgi:hypothetical protein